MEKNAETLQLSLLEGVFSRQEALDLLSQLVEVKIRFHEGQMKNLTEVEDLKMREKRIQALQSELNSLREELVQSGQHVALSSKVFISC